jgi:hypothetical protein
MILFQEKNHLLFHNLCFFPSSFTYGSSRVRPNFVISGGGPYVEDEWDKIRINGQLFSSVGPCNRCTMICIDRDTAKFQKEPLLTLSSYRRDSKVSFHFPPFLFLHTHTHTHSFPFSFSSLKTFTISFFV